MKISRAQSDETTHAGCNKNIILQHFHSGLLGEIRGKFGFQRRQCIEKGMVLILNVQRRAKVKHKKAIQNYVHSGTWSIGKNIYAVSSSVISMQTDVTLKGRFVLWDVFLV